MKDIGQWLKDRRIASGKTQLDTSYDTYISVETIRAIEKGKIYPRTNHFEKLCIFFGVEPGDYYHRRASDKALASQDTGGKFPPDTPNASGAHDNSSDSHD